MSRGPGRIEQRIGDLLAATKDQNRALSVADLCDAAFELKGKPATRAQRLSATRAGHRVIRRVSASLDEYLRLLNVDSAGPERERLFEAIWRIGLWLAGDDLTTWGISTLGKGRSARLLFHPADYPPQVWAVTIDRSGVHWFDTELVRVTERNVMVRYGGVVARLDRRTLHQSWAFWRGVQFVSSRTGDLAAKLDEVWRARYYGTSTPPPAMQMPLAEAIERLGVPVNFSRDDVLAGFRRAAKRAHPDAGGTAEIFRKLVEARDRLLASIGTSAPPPKPPAYAPSGAPLVYRVWRGGGARRRLSRGD